MLLVRYICIEILMIVNPPAWLLFQTVSDMFLHRNSATFV